MTFTMPHAYDGDQWAICEHLTKAQRVENSVAALDAVLPGWADKVDIETFNITSSARCIIAQAFGDYIHNLYLHRPILGEYRSLDNDHFCFWGAQVEWLEVLRSRQAKAEPSLSDRLRSVVAEMREAGYTVNVNFIAPAEVVTL